MNARVKVIAPLLATVTVLAAAGCGGDELDSGDPGDKTITVYSGRGESLVKPALEKFQKQSGITVKVRYGTTAQLAAQLAEEGGRSPADVFFAQDSGALGAVAKEGMLAKLPTEVLDKVPAAYRSREGEWVGVTGRSRVLAYNPSLVPEADLPASVFELTDAKWRGKVGIAPTNGSFQAFITALRVLHGDAKAKEFLAGLKANDAQIRENNIQIVTDVNDGKLATGLVNHYYLYEQAKEKGITPDQMTVKLHFFPNGDIGALVNVAGVGVLDKAANDPDARALVDYLLSTEGQTHFAAETYEYPLVAGVPTAPGLPALDTLAVPDIDLNDLDTLDATVAMIKETGLA